MPEASQQLQQKPPPQQLQQQSYMSCRSLHRHCARQWAGRSQLRDCLVPPAPAARSRRSCAAAGIWASTLPPLLLMRSRAAMDALMTSRELTGSLSSAEMVGCASGRGAAFSTPTRCSRAPLEKPCGRCQQQQPTTSCSTGYVNRDSASLHAVSPGSPAVCCSWSESVDITDL